MDHLVRAQGGVVARRQLAAIGIDDHDIRRLVRRRELAIVHPGVYVNHTGSPTWLQRAWAGVLHAWPAALSGPSAIRAVDGPGRIGSGDETIHVVVDRHRSMRTRPGLVFHRRVELASSVLWNVGPPRQRYEEAIIDVVLAADRDIDAIAALAAGCGGRRTTAERLATTVAARSRVPQRAWIEAVLRDVADGTCSVLEHGYLDKVERPHGLPRARRQLRTLGAAGPVYRDAEVGGTAIIELDGRLFHDSVSARDRDMERDLDAALDGQTTVRLGWGQVYDRPCSTADKVGRFLARLGWEGTITPCGPDCTSAR